MKFTKSDEKYIARVINHLKKYDINLDAIAEIEQQIKEHIQESRVHGDEGLNQLGEPTALANEYLKIYGIDTKSSPQRNTQKRAYLWSGLFTLPITYLICQLLFSMFLTDSFVGDGTNKFQYNILYRISENLWWNSLLVGSSFLVSILVSVGLAVYVHKKTK